MSWLAGCTASGPREAGKTEVPCIVEPMTWPEAAQAAVKDNRAHGLRLSPADKRAAIRLLLAEVEDLSSRAVAELVGCSHHTVEEVRAQVGNLPTSPEPVPQAASPGTSPPPEPAAFRRQLRVATRKGRDGKLYPHKAGPRPGSAATGERQRPAAVADLGAALLVDLRTKAAWVAGYLRCVLRTTGGAHRVEALDEVLGCLDAAELRELARRAEQAAEARGGGQAVTTADAAAALAH
jgi:hypothetical protein